MISALELRELYPVSAKELLTHKLVHEISRKIEGVLLKNKKLNKKFITYIIETEYEPFLSELLKSQGYSVKVIMSSDELYVDSPHYKTIIISWK